MEQKYYKLKKEDFNAGSPFSCWLKEELVGETSDHINGFENRGLVKKHSIRADKTTLKIVRNISKLDDLPHDLRKVAVDIIKMELDPTFEG